MVVFAGQEAERRPLSPFPGRVVYLLRMVREENWAWTICLQTRLHIMFLPRQIRKKKQDWKDQDSKDVDSDPKEPAAPRKSRSLGPLFY
jgi:hypothetical protein